MSLYPSSGLMAPRGYRDSPGRSTDENPMRLLFAFLVLSPALHFGEEIRLIEAGVR
jgi:hypothetical protein